MEQIAFFDTKPYDKEWFLKFGSDYKFKFYESKLTSDSAELAKGCKAVVAFVNDTLDKDTIDKLCEVGVDTRDVHEHYHCEHILQYALCHLYHVYVVFGTDTAYLVENSYCVLAYNSYDCSHNMTSVFRAVRSAPIV